MDIMVHFDEMWFGMTRENNTYFLLPKNLYLAHPAEQEQH
jgi:hypothetical protein